MIICIIAEPTQGIFPKEKISLALQQTLQTVRKITSDCFQSLRDELQKNKTLGQISERGYELRVDETHRDQEQFGSVPTIEIEGDSFEAVRLRFTVGEKMIVAKFMEVVKSENMNKASQALPKVKLLISGIYPEVQFKDITSDKRGAS